MAQTEVHSHVKDEVRDFCRDYLQTWRYIFFLDAQTHYFGIYCNDTTDLRHFTIQNHRIIPQHGSHASRPHVHDTVLQQTFVGLWTRNPKSSAHKLTPRIGRKNNHRHMLMTMEMLRIISPLSKPDTESSARRQVPSQQPDRRFSGLRILA